MHEVGLIADALDRAVATATGAGAERIERVRFAVLAGGHVTVDSIETIFASLSRGTIAEGAAIEVEQYPRPALCLACGAEFDQHDASLACPACGGQGAPQTDEPEVMLTSIDVAD